MGSNNASSCFSFQNEQNMQKFRYKTMGLHNDLLKTY